VNLLNTRGFEKRCLIFTRWSTANGGRNKATRLSVLMIFFALKGRPSKVFFFFKKVHYCLVVASYGYSPANIFKEKIHGLSNV
jgi:hypothetical protein